MKKLKEAIKTRQIELRPGDARLSDTFVCCHYCQATKQFFSMLCANQGWCAGRHQRLRFVSGIQNFLLSFKVHYLPVGSKTQKGPKPLSSGPIGRLEGSNSFSSKELQKLGVVAHACNLNSWEAGAGGMQEEGHMQDPASKRVNTGALEGRRGGRRQRCGEQVQLLAIN